MKSRSLIGVGLVSAAALYVVVGLIERHRASEILQSGQSPEVAVARYERVRRLWPFLHSREDLAAAYNCLGRHLMATGDFQGAIRCFQKAEELAILPGRKYPLLKASATRWQAHSLIRAGEAKTAIAVAQRGLDYFTKEDAMLPASHFPSYREALHANLLFDFVEAYALLGQTDKVIRILEDAIRGSEHGEQIAFQAELAIHLALAGRHDEAGALAASVLENEGVSQFTMARAHYALMLCARDSGDEEAAEKEEAAARKLMPEDAFIPPGLPWFPADSPR